MTTPETIPYRPRRMFLNHYGSTLLGQGFLLGLGTLTGIMAARMLGPVGRGEYGAIIIWPMAIVNIIALGIPHAAVFNLGQRTFNVSEVATATTVIGLIQSALSIAIGLLIVPFTLAKHSPTVQHLGIIVVLFMPLMILGGYTGSLFQGSQDLLRFNLIRVMAPLVYFAGLVGLYIAHQGNLNSVIFWQLSGYVLALVLGSTMVGRVLKPRWQWNSQAIPHLISYGTRIQGLSIATYVNQRIDQLILSLLVPPRQLGLYAVAVTLSMLVTVFPQATGIVTFSKGSGQKSDDAKATMGVAFRASLLWLLACCTLLFALSPVLIHFVFGPAFDGSILACRILAPGALMIGLNQILYNGASALGRPGLPSIAEGVSVGVTAIGLYLLVPRYGYVGAAIASSAAYTFSFFVMLALAHTLLGVRLRDLLLSRPDTQRS